MVHTCCKTISYFYWQLSKCISYETTVHIAHHIAPFSLPYQCTYSSSTPLHIHAQKKFEMNVSHNWERSFFFFAWRHFSKWSRIYGCLVKYTYCLQTVAIFTLNAVFTNWDNSNLVPADIEEYFESISSAVVQPTVDTAILWLPLTCSSLSVMIVILVELAWKKPVFCKIAGRRPVSWGNCFFQQKLGA